jgi:prevent-host-death family protein
MTESVVSIRELKSRLSHYLRLARRGESVVITDRGIPVGRLVPVEQDLEGRVVALRAAGLLQWSGRRLTPRKPVAKIPRGKTVAALLVEDRG